MKPQVAIFVFLLLVSSAILTGIDSLYRSERQAQEAVNKALVRTMELCEPNRINRDTIQVYRSFITMDAVRDTAYLSLDMVGEERQLKVTACTGLTFDRLWEISDQRASAGLSALSILWLIICFAFKPVPDNLPTEPGDHQFHYAATEHCFYAGNQAIHFTPMQQTLMELFWEAPNHQLSQKHICEQLWPKKPDASATLYTLIRRLKPIIKDKANMTIECRRGEFYQLIIK